MYQILEIAALSLLVIGHVYIAGVVIGLWEV